MAKGRVVLLHFVAQMPMAGIAWQALQYLVGLQKLGYDTWYVENHGANPYDPRANSVMMDCSYNVAFLKESIERFGFAGRWAYWDAINDVYHGLSRERVFDLLKGADALINLCGATRLREEHMACPVRIMVDTDPVYEQIKYAKADPEARAYLDAHTHFFTYGENVGGPGWIVPLCGVPVAADAAAGRARASGPRRRARPNASAPSPPGRTRARTSSSKARLMSGRSM